MEGITVLRVIPPEYVEGIKQGIYKVCGGVIRRADGPIVAHLQFRDPESMGALGLSFQPLMNATLALSALNLAVTVAGFVMVYGKLKEINQKLERVESRLIQVFQILSELEWTQEAQRRAALSANLENLHRGLRIGEPRLTYNALARLTESAEFYRLAAERLLSDLPRVYCEPLLVREILMYIYAARLAQAHAFALEGHGSEAVQILEALIEWQAEYQSKMDTPLQVKPAPIWLGGLSYEQRKTFRDFRIWNLRTSEGLEYARNQYQLCAEYGISPQDLAQLTQDEPLAVLVLDRA